jgi:predicted TIM-barrel fold metal-dependent hydrolase
MIDIHTHLFNLKYLPVQGIITRFTKGIVPDIIAGPIANVLIRHTRSDFDTEKALLPITTLHEKIYGEKQVFKGTSVFELNETDTIGLIVSNFSVEEIHVQELQDALIEFYSITNDQDKAQEFSLLFQNMKNHALIGLNTHDYLSFGNALKKMLNWIISKIDQGANFIRWAYVMQHSENDLFNMLKKDVPDMKYYVHHMMDVDFYFNSKPSYFDFQTKQIENMQALNNKYKDKLIAFIAFDPSKENCLDIVKDAIENKGFKGVKFYPPMGYRAADNEGGKKPIDKINETLFRYCIQNDIPIFAHCNNNGFEANTHTGYNSKPLYWQTVLVKEEFKKLRLNLAHAGGTPGWFCKIYATDQIKLSEIDDVIFDSSDQQKNNWNASYAKIVYKLCLTYENVYCDAAYLDEVSDPQLLKNFTDRLTNLFKTESSFAQKIMFGTDWHMLFREGENASFFMGYDKLFESSGPLGAHRDDFFENNALRYLKMSD